MQTNHLAFFVAIGGEMGGVKAVCCGFFGVLSCAIHKRLPKVSSDNLILMAKSHHHAKNQELGRETEKHVQINRTDQNG